MAGRGFAGGQRPPREGRFGHENFGDNMEGFHGSNPRFQFGVASTRVLSVGGTLSGGREEQEGTSIRTESMNLI